MIGLGRGPFFGSMQRSAVEATRGADANQLVPTDKAFAWLLVVSSLFAQQIAVVNIGEFPGSIDVCVYGIFAIYLIFKREVFVELPTLVILLVFAFTAAVVTSYSPRLSSASSLGLLLFLYWPFILYFSDAARGRALAKYAINLFVMLVVVLSIIACIQAILVNLFGFSSLTNIIFNLPDGIKAAGKYMNAREEGGIIKANGFFLKEASTLSLVAAMAVALEFTDRARPAVLLCLVAGLLASMSGTGLFILLAVLLIPTSRRGASTSVLALVGMVLLIAVDAGDSGMHIWTARVDEFSEEGTSGYARFVAPIEIFKTWASGPLGQLLLGNGAGSYQRFVDQLNLPYEINDPTWARMFFEYGLFGAGLLIALFLRRCGCSTLQLPVCNAFLVAWLFAGGEILNPQFVEVVWVCSLYGRSARADLEKPQEVERPRRGET